MKKKSDTESITIIRLKLCRPIGCDVEQFWKAINDCGYSCDLARNGMLRFWLRWREDHPEWQPELKRDQEGNPIKRKSGETIVANCPAPSIQMNERKAKGETCRWCRGEGKKRAIVLRENADGIYEPVCEKHRLLNFSTMLYRVGSRSVSRLAADCMTVIAAEVWSMLTANAPWVPGNKSLYRWQAILSHEVSLPTCRSRKIPIKNSGIRIGWDDCCWIDFALWSKDEKPNRYKVECKVANLPAGKKRLLQEAIAGERKISDSYLVDRKSRRGDDWELHLVVKQPERNQELNAERTIKISALNGDADRPFLATLPDGTEIRIGRGIPLVKEYERLTLRRKAIRASNRLGAMKGGHGARRIMAKITTESRRYGGVQSAFHRDLADIVYRLCQDHNCGRVEYDEPPTWGRESLWFAKRNTPFDWTNQSVRLVGKLKRRGVDVLVVSESKPRSKKHEKVLAD